MVRNNFFAADRITDSTVRITGIAGELCYLVEGQEKALLIDGLTGVGSLKAFVRELTELPVMMAVTHGHLDHVGAAWEYGECFIDPRDISLMYEEKSSSPKVRLDFVRSRIKQGMAEALPTPADVPAPMAVRTYPIHEGHIFDLGGVQLEAIPLPGHTQGSLVFLNRAERVLFSGDACNANTILAFDEATTVQEYAENLRSFKRYQGAFDVMYGGHKRAPVPNTILDDAIALCEKIMAGRDDAVPVHTPDGLTGYFAAEREADFTPKCGGYANILYDKERIFKEG